MLAVCFDCFSLGFTADTAGVSHNAIITAIGRSGFFAFIPCMISGDGLVTQTCAAKIADILADTGSSTGCFLQCRIKNRYMSIGNCGYFFTFNEYLFADRANHLACPAGSVAGCFDIFYCFFGMTECGSSNIFGIFFNFLFTANTTGEQNAGSSIAGCILMYTVIPCMTECLGYIGFGVIAAAALESVKTTLVTGCCYICFIFCVKLHIVTECFASFYYSGFTLCTADGALFTDLCRFVTGCFDSSLFHVVFFILFIPSIIA